MLLDNKYTIVPSLKFSLTYENGVRKIITVKAKDTIDCTYKKNGEILNIVGVVAKIGCNFNSSLGNVGTTAYIQVDGSCTHCGCVEYIQPEQVLDLTIISTTDTVNNAVCSVDNEDQKITLVRENEVGVFQYSLDGITWNGVTANQGKSAYECAVELGFNGTEEEWLESLHGSCGETGAIDIFAVFRSAEEAHAKRCEVPEGKLIVVSNENSTTIKDSILYVRHDSCECDSHGCNCGCDCNNEDKYYICGYKYAGKLNMGPTGGQGRPGKSAYETAVEAGFPGTEDEFARTLANCAVAVTNCKTGPDLILQNTLYGPIDLKVFGFTNTKTLISKKVSSIDISCPNELDDQTLIFPEPVVLRSVPTNNAAAKPNITMNGMKFIADCITRKDGQIGVLRRVKYIDSYNGETIISDWISSTGELDMGSKVQYATYGEFEPFDPLVQKQYSKLHSYDGETRITTPEHLYLTATYPVNIKDFLDNAEGGGGVKLKPGNNITIEKDVISSTGNLFTETFVTTKELGGLAAGTTIKAGDDIRDILKQILCPPIPPAPPEEKYVLWGTSPTPPTSIEGLTKEIKDDELVKKGISHKFTANDQHLVFAYKKSIGLVESIRDNSGFENIDGWSYTEYKDPESGKDFYIYYSNESNTITNFKLTFLYE